MALLDRFTSRSGEAPADDPLRPLLNRLYTLDWERVLYITLFVLAVFTRFYNLGDRVMSHDESLHTRYSYNLYHDGNFQHSPLMHGPILFHMTALSYFLFGDNDFTARIYTAVLGVLMVMFPLLFRRWLGRTGALVASFLMLISPMLMYYNRYIREDTPSIFFTMVMAYATLRYLSGEGRHRQARWLYILAGAMLCSLGSKESGFFYIIIFALVLLVYWFSRLVQHFQRVSGRQIFNFLFIGFLLGSVASMGMITVLSIIRPETAFIGGIGTLEGTMFLTWTAAIIGSCLVALVGSALWAFRSGQTWLRIGDILIVAGIAVVTCIIFIFLEEIVHVEETAETTSTFSWLPIVAVWAVALVTVGLAFLSRAGGWWKTLYRFPELDVIIVIGTLSLPWVVAAIVKAAGGNPIDYGPEGIARSVMALVPLLLISAAIGLAWNWKRWLIAFGVFFALYVFFFTTMFSNAQGMATGVVGSLGYWIEQQGVRRGNQPQYYYFLVIMPFYEFLPIIGSVLAMFAGLTHFWHMRRRQLDADVTAPRPPEKAKNRLENVGYRQSSYRAPALAPDDPNYVNPFVALQRQIESGDVDVIEKPKRGEVIEETIPEEGDDLPSLGELMEPTPEMVERESGYYIRGVPREEYLTHLPFLIFVSCWAVLNLIVYTLAGEKMPWLATHMTTPMILLSGWYFGRVIERIDVPTFLRAGWRLLPLGLLLFVALFQVAEPFLLGQSLVFGLEQQDLSRLYEWLFIVLASLVVLGVIFYTAYRTGWQHFTQVTRLALFVALAVLTFRSAWMFSFINYDYAAEFGVYAHSNTNVKTVLNQIDELSRLTTGGDALKFAYDNETSWPNSWYFRDFPNATFVGGNPTPANLTDAVAVVVGEANRSKVEPILEDRYYHFEYIRMWWPMQDYFNLTAARIANTFDFTATNTQASEIRHGLWDIWWSRDYERYSEAIDANWTLTQWPISDRMHLYIRKDFAAQVWTLGIGESTVMNPLDSVQANMCTENWQDRYAEMLYEPMQTNGAMNHPIDVEVGADGLVYVADEFNNRIVVFGSASPAVSQDGAMIASTQADMIRQIGPQPDGSSIFNRPNGVAIGPDGNLYVADTWNFRIQVVSPEGEVLRSWGQAGQFGAEAPQSPVDGFWGPRDVEVDPEGNVYVADTGNKRIRVYNAMGEWLRDIGSAGASFGQVDEPSGLAISNGMLFVGDTWNRRVSVFTLTGEPVTTYSVRGWYEDMGNRPYLAVDSTHNLMYVADMDAGRVLVYDGTGCVGSFGQAMGEFPGLNQFKTVGGIATDSSGNVYVVDAGMNRVLRFSPFPRLDGLQSAPLGVIIPEDLLNPEVSEEATEEVIAEITPEPTSEVGLLVTEESDPALIADATEEQAPLAGE